MNPPAPPKRFTEVKGKKNKVRGQRVFSSEETVEYKCIC